MKKATVWLLAVGSVIAIGVMAKRKGQFMREHCEQMAERCKEMAAGPGAHDQTVAKV
jgi:hypothetical protein